MRKLQPQLPFPPTTNLLQFALPVYRNALGRKIPATVWNAQPRRFLPRGHPYRDRPRAEYARHWIEQRKALGLPHDITDRLYAAALQQEKKTA